MNKEDGWQTIETAPRCVMSGIDRPNDNGRRPVIVTRHPVTGGYHPMAIARLTQKGWITGKRNNLLWFEPTHWQPLPTPPSEASNVTLAFHKPAGVDSVV